MKRIMLLTDFSDTARNAALYALKMFEKENMTFYLMNAYDLEFSGSPYVVQIQKELEEESMKALNDEYAILHRRFPDAKIQLLSLFGSLIEVINKELIENAYDLIVLGCRGESALENFLLGSRAYEVIKNIEAPIFVIPKHAKYSKPETIAFATDLRDFEDDRMIDPIRDIAHMLHAPLLFVNVLDEEDYLNRIECEEKIAEHFPGINVSFNFIEDEDIVKGINNFMEENEAGIVAMVRHNAGMFERLFHPSITRQMVMHPEYPMLILHDHGKTKNAK